MGWEKVCGTARSGIWVLKGNARARMLPDTLEGDPRGRMLPANLHHQSGAVEAAGISQG